MRIVSGRGNTRRVVLDVPDGLVVRRSPQNEQKALTEFVCQLVGIGHNSVQLPHDGKLVV